MPVAVLGDDEGMFEVVESGLLWWSCSCVVFSFVSPDSCCCCSGSSGLIMV